MHLKETFLDLVYAQKKKKDLAYSASLGWDC